MTDPRAGSDRGASFLHALRERARGRSARIVFPEGEEPRVQAAVAEGLAERLFFPTLIGHPARVREGLREAGVESPDAVPVLDPTDAGLVARVEHGLIEARDARGATHEGIDLLSLDPLAQAGVLLRMGDVDGAVGGCVRTTVDVIRAALNTLGMRKDVRTLSSAFFMVFEPDHPVGPKVLTFTDAGVVPAPSARQLAEIAASAARAHRAVVGEEPRVAFLSYSTKGSAEGAAVSLASEALERFRVILPDVAADGELQGDAALVPEVARRKAPDSEVAGRANVLVFPDLAAANLSYKLVQHLGGAHALGPILQGLHRPYNDLSRGASAADIVAVACITALMAGAGPEGAGPHGEAA